jgi:hypothetical protein
VSHGLLLFLSMLYDGDYSVSEDASSDAFFFAADFFLGASTAASCSSTAPAATAFLAGDAFLATFGVSSEASTIAASGATAAAACSSTTPSSP